MTDAAPVNQRADGALIGRRILLTRDPGRGAGYHEALRSAGAEPIFDPLQTQAPTSDPAALTAALRALAAGDYDWLVLTSARAVDALAAGSPVAVGGARVAVVGRATARRAEAAGLRVDLCPEQESAAGLLAQWPSPGAPSPAGPHRSAPSPAPRVLLPVSALAPDTLADGLRARGARVDRVEAYRMVPTPAGYPLRAALADGSLAAAVVTSGSAAARLRDVLAQAHVPQPPLVAIGPATARAAVDCGLVVAATAAHPDPGSVLDALRHAVSAPSPEET